MRMRCQTAPRDGRFSARPKRPRGRILLLRCRSIFSTGGTVSNPFSAELTLMARVSLLIHRRPRVQRNLRIVRKWIKVDGRIRSKREKSGVCPNFDSRRSASTHVHNRVNIGGNTEPGGVCRRQLPPRVGDRPDQGRVGRTKGACRSARQPVANPGRHRRRGVRHRAGRRRPTSLSTGGAARVSSAKRRQCRGPNPAIVAGGRCVGGPRQRAGRSSLASARYVTGARWTASKTSFTSFPASIGLVA